MIDIKERYLSLQSEKRQELVEQVNSAEVMIDIFRNKLRELKKKQANDLSRMEAKLSRAIKAKEDAEDMLQEHDLQVKEVKEITISS